MAIPPERGPVRRPGPNSRSARTLSCPTFFMTLHILCRSLQGSYSAGKVLLLSFSTWWCQTRERFQGQIDHDVLGFFFK